MPTRQPAVEYLSLQRCSTSIQVARENIQASALGSVLELETAIPSSRSEFPISIVLRNDFAIDPPGNFSLDAVTPRRFTLLLLMYSPR